MELVAPSLDAPPLYREAPPVVVVGASPAAGANFTQAVDDGLWWRLLAVTVRLNTDATVANRTLRVEFRGPDAIAFLVCGNPVTYPGSTVNEDYYFSVWQPAGEWEVATSNLVPLAPVLLQPGQDWRIAVTNIQAGDTLTRIRYLAEKFYPPRADDFPAP